MANRTFLNNKRFSRSGKNVNCKCLYALSQNFKIPEAKTELRGEIGNSKIIVVG